MVIFRVRGFSMSIWLVVVELVTIAIVPIDLLYILLHASIENVRKQRSHWFWDLFGFGGSFGCEKLFVEEERRRIDRKEDSIDSSQLEKGMHCSFLECIVITSYLLIIESFHVPIDLFSESQPFFSFFLVVSFSSDDESYFFFFPTVFARSLLPWN